ncbi:unnamed protein product, partial [Didymodactylos carnosus]
QDVTKYPIEFFIKYEDLFIDNPPKKAFQYSGIRKCRGAAISCAIFTTTHDKFPPIPETRETWDSTIVEWAWAFRQPSAPPSLEDQIKQFDYPIHLYLKFLKQGINSDLFDIRKENIEYQFYEFNTDVHQDEFDISQCYRSNDLGYKHLTFNLKIEQGGTSDVFDNNHLDRHRLHEHIFERLMNAMNIAQSRISNLEIDHDQQSNQIYVLFTLLDKTPLLNRTDELDIGEAKRRLSEAINTGNQFEFDMPTLDNTVTIITIKAISNTLDELEHYNLFYQSSTTTEASFTTISTTTGTAKATSSDPVTTAATTTTSILPTLIVQQITEQIREKIVYSYRSQTGAIVGGLLAGILLGLLSLFLLNRKSSTVDDTASVGYLSMTNVNFRSKKQTSDVLQMDNRK